MNWPPKSYSDVSPPDRCNDIHSGYRGSIRGRASEANRNLAGQRMAGQKRGLEAAENGPLASRSANRLAGYSLRLIEPPPLLMSLQERVVVVVVVVLPV